MIGAPGRPPEESPALPVLPGEPRPGGRTLGLLLAGIPVTVHGLTDRAAAIVRRRFARWTAPAPGAGRALLLELSWVDASYRNDALGRDEELRIDRGGLVLGRASAGVWRRDGHLEAVLADDPAWLGQEIENLLRLAVARHLLARGGLLLHGASALLGGGAVVFPAASGTGKSTLARELEAAGIETLGDDMAAVVPDGDGWCVHALPFTGEAREHRRPGAYPLRAIHPLHRGAGPRFEPLEPGAAAGAIAAQTLGLGAFPALSAAGLRTAAAVTTAVPVERLVRRKGDAAPAALLARHGGAA